MKLHSICLLLGRNAIAMAFPIKKDNIFLTSSIVIMKTAFVVLFFLEKVITNGFSLFIWIDIL